MSRRAVGGPGLGHSTRGLPVDGTNTVPVFFLQGSLGFAHAGAGNLHTAEVQPRHHRPAAYTDLIERYVRSVCW